MNLTELQAQIRVFTEEECLTQFMKENNYPSECRKEASESWAFAVVSLGNATRALTLAVLESTKDMDEQTRETIMREYLNTRIL